MQPCHPWLCQGDIFKAIVQSHTPHYEDGSVKLVTTIGPALLLTHGCDLDKPLKSGEPRIERLQFLPLLDLSVQDDSRKELLRKQELNPAEAFYIGQVEGAGESYCLLSEMYSFPAAYFSPELREFPDHEAAEPGKSHLACREHADRAGRLEDDRLQLLYRKMVRFWTRYEIASFE